MSTPTGSATLTPTTQKFGSPTALSSAVRTPPTNTKRGVSEFRISVSDYVFDYYFVVFFFYYMVSVCSGKVYMHFLFLIQIDSYTLSFSLSLSLSVALVEYLFGVNGYFFQIFKSIYSEGDIYLL